MRKPVRMWALWWDGEKYPLYVDADKSCVSIDSRADYGQGKWKIVRVEIRPARKAKAKRKKARRG